jgi:uncharacterized membrane protein YuzA (DUF378 family)
VTSGRLRAGWLAATAAGIGLLGLVGVLGDSAAVPGLGPATATPPWDTDAHAPAWQVTALGAAGYAFGAVAVLLGLRLVARGDPGLRPARLLVAGVVAAGLLTLVPPVGSADHLSYVAYGRIAAAGDDPYAVAPIEWHSGHDPVAGAVQPPWQRTPSVYGPVATALQALAAVAGHGSLRLTVWWWQLVCAMAFVVIALVVDRLAGPDPARRARAGLLWTLNPLLLGQLVLGAHLDVVAAAWGIAGLAVATRSRPGALGALGAGALFGAAVATKAPYALFGLAAVWGLRRLPRWELARAVVLGAAGALAVVVPAHAWAGPHVFDQLRTASRYTSLASPWRAVANVGDLVLGRGAVNAVATYLALGLAAVLAALLWQRRVRELPAGAAARPGADALRAALALTVAWALVAPYALPWYDAMVWAPLALVGPSLLDAVLAVRLLGLALAYVPGRVVGLTPPVEAVTLGVRTFAAPVLALAAVVVVVRWAARPSQALSASPAVSPP